MSTEQTPTSNWTNDPQGSRMGSHLIAAERQRQIDVEGWTPEHDDAQGSCELNLAAAAYCFAAQLATTADTSDMTPEDWAKWMPDYWPWDESYWKPSNDPIPNLVKAGALIAAEIDRLKRAEAS